MVRDRANEDKLYQVLEPLDTVTLTYNPDNDNRLAFVKTVYPEYEGLEISQIIKLGYQDYLNSKNEIENVVTTIEQRTWAKALDSSTVEFENQSDQAEGRYNRLQNELTEQILKNENN